MIHIQQMCKRYPPDLNALCDIDLEVAEGEMLLIGGHSGAGKSTLLRLIAAIERPTSGLIRVGGVNISTLKRHELPVYRRNIGLVLQDQKLLFDRCAQDNVLLPLAIAGFAPDEALRRAHAALDKVGLLSRAQAMPIALSGGEQQRLAIARAVVRRPRLLIADEPTAHLDSATATDVARIFLDFNQVGITVLIATYDATLFPKSRAITLDHGRICS
jgi:cell division transport system ATP-binding protein